MASDSDQNDFSRFSMNNSSYNNTTNDSQSNQSNDQTNIDTTNAASINEITNASINDATNASINQSGNETTDDSNDDQSDQSSMDGAANDFIDDAADESVIVHKRKKIGKRLILDSDSESDKDREESEVESDERKSGSDNKSDEEDSNEYGSDEENKENKSEVKDESDDENVSKNDRKSMTKRRSNGSKRKSNRESRNRFNRSGNSDANESDRSMLNSTKSSEVVIPETDDEDEEEDAERSQMHVFSPRTRRSITGRRSIKPSVINSDEDDDEIFSEASDSAASRSNANLSVDATKYYDTTENFKRNRSIAPNDSAVIKTPNAKRFSQHNVDISTSTPSRSTPDIEFSDKSNVSQTSSIHISVSDKEMKSVDSVVVLNSSDEENHKPLSNSTAIDFKGVGTSTPGTSGKLIQPKLHFGRQQPKFNKTFVSRDFYTKKEDELIRVKQELTQNEELFNRLAPTLPDKGQNLKRRVNDLQRQVHKMEGELAKYAIEEDHLDEIMVIETTNNNKPKIEAKDWRADLDDLKNIQPRWTGEQGLSTFNTQKTLTFKRIEKLHKAMDKCPTPDDLARQPDNLNVQLMPHQLHAIKWMRWREAQKPKGGILADDMGLGKTLTVIGLVLDAKYRKHQSLAEEDEDEDENTEDESESDDENERGYKKSYSNQGGTLIVCPASLINQWESEINNRVKRRKLTVLLMHGNKRNETAHSICKYDLVITTYGIISSDHKNNGALFRIRWDRIVLDEAHMIRNHTTAVSKGCCDLRGNLRWGLTGTPIQNKHMDVYSMLKFLRVTPFDDLATYKKWIDPKTEAGMSRLHNILKPLLLRRTKTELQIKGELQALPSKNILIEDVELTPDEANIYTKILAYSQTLFAQYMDQHQQRHGSVPGGGKFTLGADVQKRLDQVRKFGRGQDVKSSQILVLLLRLRQICDHPGLIHQMLQDECDLEDCDEEEYDSVDMNIVKQMIGLKINDDGKGRGHNSSSEEEVKSSNILLSTNKMYDFKHPSSKCKRTIEIVKRILRESDDKIVVVSQWTTFLTIVADLLHRERVHYVELTGKTPIKDRNNIVVSFNNPDSPERVMMLSLVAGGVGLNLTGANHLILLDPHWNPQLESQAFDRIYRVGQTKDVQIYKLLCEKTVEKHIQSIQENKLQLSDNVLTGSKQGSGSKLSIQDMRKLFDM